MKKFIRSFTTKIDSYHNIFYPAIVTKLNIIQPPYLLHKRFYPRTPHLIKASLENLKMLTPSNNVTALALYDPTIRTRIIQYSQSHNPILASQRMPPIFPLVNNINKIIPKPIVPRVILESTSKEIQLALDYFWIIEPPTPEDYINTLIYLTQKISRKELISNDYLLNLLNHLKSEEHISTDYKTALLDLLRNYFQTNYPTEMIAKLFLKAWEDKIEKTTSLNTVKEESTPTTLKEKALSFDEKKVKEQEKYDQIVPEIMKTLKLLENDTKALVDSGIVDKWLTFLDNREISTKELTLEEKQIYDNFKRIPLPDKKTVLSESSNKDKLQGIKGKSNIDSSLKEPLLKKHFLPDDYTIDIDKIKQILTDLEPNTTLTPTDLRLLSILSSATIIEEGKVKLTQEAYIAFRKNETFFGIKYLTDKPLADHIFKKLENKEFIVVEKIEGKRPNEVLLTSPLLHKTIVIDDQDNQGKKIRLRIGMFTSSHLDGTFKLSDTQEINLEVEKQNREQRFLIFPYFVLVDHDEPIFINIDATLFARGRNREGENVLDILINQYKEQQSTWSNNPIQEPFVVTLDVLRKLTQLFYERHLQELQAKYASLIKELNELSEKRREETLEEWENEKKNELIQQEDRLYFRELPIVFQNLIKALHRFEELNQKDQQIKEKKDKKKKVNVLMELQKEKEALKKKGEGLTAKEKKEQYIKNKQNKANEENNPD